MLPSQFLLILVVSYSGIMLLKLNQLAEVLSGYQLAINISLLGTLLYSTCFEGISFFINWKLYVLNAERIEKANLVAKYETLKKQVHPHFLFNSLNILIGLIENNDKKAGEYTQKLADFLKYLLTYQQKETITLAEELDIVKQYTFIQQVRFNENLKVIIDIDKSLENKTLPPLALQMLVENAIKHNIISGRYPLTVIIKSTNDQKIQVENIVKKKQQAKSASIGLKNIFERYKHLNVNKPVIEEIDDKFVVKLPLI